MNKIIIKNGKVVIPGENFVGKRDILIEGGIIAQIGDNIPTEGAEIIDAKGYYVIPGIVDMHVHLRDPDGTEEDIYSGTMACAKGGVTTACCMPNTNPCIDNPTIVRYIMLSAERYGKVKVYPIGAMTIGREGKRLALYDRMKSEGIIAVSDDGNWVEDPLVMKSVLETANMYGLLPISHCEDKRVSQDGVINEGIASLKLGLPGIPPLAEVLAISRDILIAKEIEARIHIAHISLRDSLDIIRRAKSAGVKVTCEVSPHHFILTDELLLERRVGLKVNPPLRREVDRFALIEGLIDESIDVIASDHAPRKTLGLDLLNDPFGISSVEIMLPLCYTFLVKAGHLSTLEMVKKLSYNPANLLGLDSGDLSVGKSADIVIFDPNCKETVNTNNFISKGKNSPYDGYELYGFPILTMVSGKVVYAKDI
ncbi:MAG: dihydroorotase [bacterium]|nr:dihydroorotase [bacterium]